MSGVLLPREGNGTGRGARAGSRTACRDSAGMHCQPLPDLGGSTASSAQGLEAALPATALP